MNFFIDSLKNSLTALKDEPKLFLPKIFLSILWGSLLLYNVNLFFRIQELTVLPENIFFELILFLIIFFVFFVLDSVINSAYPLMIEKYLKKQSFSVLNSIKFVLMNFFKIVFPVMLVSVVIFFVLIPFVLIFSFFLMQKNFFLLIFSGLIVLLVSFVLVVLFYFIYPVASIERKGIPSVFNSIKKSRKKLREASFGSFILLLLSFVSAVIVSLEQASAVSFIALFFFILLRILTALFSTYAMVLNPVLYFKNEK